MTQTRNAVRLPGDREVVIAHDEQTGPLTAVRSALIQSSLAQLRERGLYERYLENIRPDVVQQLSSTLGPTWVPIDLADAHYRACDGMGLTPQELDKLGTSTGERVRQMSLVLANQKMGKDGVDVWSVLGQFHRVWGRLYQGGSVQFVRVAANNLLLELRGFSLNRHRYYRYGNVAAVAGTYEAAGLNVDSTKLASYDPATHEATIQLTWK